MIMHIGKEKRGGVVAIKGSDQLI